ncbi:MAG: metallophosphoesterase [Actinobacteria bacterium]|nr:metallophosphoesterase [Actinomycetota bacterium]
MMRDNNKKIIQILLLLFLIYSILVLMGFTGCKEQVLTMQSPVNKSIQSTGSQTSISGNTANETAANKSTAESDGKAVTSSITHTPEDKILFSFTVAGDNRPANNELPQPDVFREILNSIKHENPSFFVNTGDIIMGNTQNPSILERQFSGYIHATSILALPMYISPGNHDVANSVSRKLFEKFFLDSGSEFFYSFKFEGINFIILNAYEPGNWGALKGQELLWLESTLTKMKEEEVFVFIHPPVYSVLNPDCITDGSKHVAFSSKKNQDYIRELFKTFKVDGVFNGHEHLFNKQNIDGTEYIITGGGGASLYVSKEKGGFYHFLRIDVKKESWICNVLDSHGNLLEQEEISFN